MQLLQPRAGKGVTERDERGASRLVLAFLGAVVLAVAGAAAVLAVQVSRPGLLGARPVTSPQRALQVHTTANLRVLSTSPTNGAVGVPPLQPVKVVFSSPLAGVPQLSFNPPIGGSWKLVSPTELEFTPSVPLLPLSTEQLVIPAGLDGVSALDGANLVTPVTVNWQVADGSVLRIQQILAQLGYLPLGFTQAGQLPGGPDPYVLALFSPPTGKFYWRYPGTPQTLEQAWAPGVANVMTRGAIVAFERANQMVAYTTVRRSLWPALLAAEQAGTLNPKGYSYVMVSENQPESLTIWHDGADVYTSVANTGISTSPTPIGTFFVYLRYASQTMQGYNPNGTYYIDHGVRWINYFDGNDAIHGFVRASYGFPQSLGCVELPVANAAVAWGWIHYGTLVTITAPSAPG